MARKEIPNKYVHIDSTAMGIVFLTKGEEVTCIFDREDYPRIRMFKWNVSCLSKRNTTRYITARPWRSSKTAIWQIRFHQLIMSFPHNSVDHVNRNGLDNRKCNLREVTALENARNKIYKRKSKSGYTGVYFMPKQPLHPWCAEIRHLGKSYRIGNFKTAVEAAEAFDKEAVKLRGEFAVINFPESKTV